MIAMVQQQASQTIQLMKATHEGAQQNQGGDSTDNLMKAMTVIQAVKDSVGGGDGGGEKDIMAVLIENLPGLLNSVGNAASKAIKEVKGLPQPNQGTTSPGTPDGSLTIPDGPLARMIIGLAERGVNPELVLVPLAAKALATPPAPEPVQVSGTVLIDGPATSAANTPDGRNNSVTQLHSVPPAAKEAGGTVTVTVSFFSRRDRSSDRPCLA